MRQRLTLADLYRLDAPRSLVVAPNGSEAVYVRQWIDPVTKQERQSLWRTTDKAGKRRPLEAGEPDARAPVWSPDGKWIAFLSTRSRPQGWKATPPVPPQSEPATDIWLIAREGGRAIPLAAPDKPYGRVFNDGFYGRLAFAPDGRRLAFVADNGLDPRTPEERAADVYVVRPDQGEGYTGYGPAQLWVAQLDTNPGESFASRIDRLTQDDVWYGDPQWSPDQRSLAVHANRTQDREAVRYSINKDFNIWAIDIQTRGLRQLTSGPGPEVSPRWSPDGTRLVCLSVPRKGSHRDTFNLAVVSLGASGPRTEVVFDHHGPGSDRPPHLAPVFPLPVDCWDGKGHLVYQGETGTTGALYRIELSTGKGRRLEETETHRRTRALTPAGDPWLHERRLGESRLVHWENDGERLEGILTMPPVDVARAPHKLIVFPHGGPHSRSAQAFDFTVQLFAAEGYAVFQPNFRGSAGYGQKFIDADRFDFGGGDMRDILTGIDSLVKEGLVDRNRQFVYGSSYGGFMTCWLIGHTRQFRAAVAQNAVTDLNAMWGLSDIPSWTEWEFGGRPWDIPAAMRRHSPLTYVANIATPTLVLHSRDDRRVPLPLGLMFHQALRARGVPTQMVIYPGEGHAIRQPRHREDVLRRTLAWFAQHDRGSTPAPDTGAKKHRPHLGLVYGNPQETQDPLNPSNRGFNPRVVDAEGKVVSFPLKVAGRAQLYYGNGVPMRTPQGELVRVKEGSVKLNYGMRLECDGRTYFMAWQANHDEPQGSVTRMATGWVAADDLTADGAAAAKAAIPRRLGNIERPIARDAAGQPRTFTVNGVNEQAMAATAQDLKYIGVTGGRHNRVINFLNLHDGHAGLQMLVNLPDMPGGGIAMDCLPNGTLFTPAADAHNALITKPIQVHDKHGLWHTLTFIYGKAGDTWGWLVKDWLD